MVARKRNWKARRVRVPGSRNTRYSAMVSKKGENRQISSGSIEAEWAPTQLGYAFAFNNRNFPAAAAMSIILLVITLAIGVLIVFRSGLFGDDREKSS